MNIAECNEGTVVGELSTSQTENADLKNPVPEHMKALVQRAFGPIDYLKVEMLPAPQIAENEILIDAYAAGVDRGTWYLMQGKPYIVRLMGFGFLKPKQIVPGLDVAGKVVAVGENVTQLKIGDEVCGIGKGAYAEYVAADASKIVLKPSHLDFAQAAGLTISGITAYEALTKVAGLSDRQKVLIVGASGGVGSHAVQIAKALGAEVTAVSSDQKTSWVKQLGADRVLDYSHDFLVTEKNVFDVIIDIGGRHPVSKLQARLTDTGTLVFVGGEGGNKITGGIGRQLLASLKSPFLNQNLKMMVSTEHPDIIAEHNQFVSKYKIGNVTTVTFPLQKAAEAFNTLASGAIAGKAVLKIKG